MTQDILVTSHPYLQPIASLHAREKSHNSTGLGHPLCRLRDKNSRHGMAVMLELQDAVGKVLL
jgi:hypothetical protein